MLIASAELYWRRPVARADRRPKPAADGSSR